MALEMIKQATAAEVYYRWVTGDCVYGDFRTIRMWLEEQRKCYMLCVSGKEYLPDGWQQVSVSSILKSLDETGWFVASCGDGSKGARVYDWQAVEIPVPVVESWRRCLLVRRSRSEGELRAHVCFAPQDVSIQKFVEVAGVRWTVECCFAESKSEVGLDEYKVRSYMRRYKHITFACLAHALLAYLSSCSLDTKAIQQHTPSSCSLSVFKKSAVCAVK
jgi:hypothetical protein